jgi:hypothetical protein
MLAYLGVASSLLGPEREHAFGRFPAWFYYLAGAALVVALPAVMWMRSRLGTAVLGALVTLTTSLVVLRIRTAASPELATKLAVFACIAAVTAVMLWRAVLSRQERPSQ